MKILFVNPSRAGQGNIPLNIPLLIAILKQAGHDVRLFDFSDYSIFDVATKEYEKMFFKETERDELKKTEYIKDFENLIIEFNPHIIAVSALSVDFKFACEFLLRFKNKYKIPVIFGGIHAILLPDEVIKEEACDYVCIGEGENALPQLLEAIEYKQPVEGIEGMWLKKHDEIIKRQPAKLTDLRTLPVPDFSEFNPIHFSRPFDGKKYIMLNYELSRGCVFNCSYCVNETLKQKYKGLGTYNRIKDIDQSIKELRYLINKYKFNFIRFWDEDFTTIKEDYLEKYYKQYLEKINLPFMIYSRVETITEKKVQLLKEMGCKTFAIGIESGNEWIRKNILNRYMSNELLINKFRIVQKYKIRVSAYNMMGLPYDTRETIFDTININRKINPDSFSVTLLEPYKGTPIRKICEEQGLDPNHETKFIGNDPQFIPKSMTYSELRGLHRTFPFYVLFSENRFDEIRQAETDDGVYKKLRKEFILLV